MTTNRLSSKKRLMQFSLSLPVIAILIFIYFESKTLIFYIFGRPSKFTENR